jgi:hypothetical protein
MRIYIVKRLMQWEFNVVVIYLFCRSCIEGRDQLFFAFGFVKRIWREVMKN